MVILEVLTDVYNTEGLARELTEGGAPVVPELNSGGGGSVA